MKHIKEIIEKLGNPAEILGKVAMEQETMGAGNTDTLSKNDCPICQGGGWVHPVVAGRADYNHVVICRCMRDKMKESRRQSLLKHCELPPMAEVMTLSNFEVYPQVKVAYEVAEQISRHPEGLAWVTFMGGNDTGKTHLAVSICREWVNKGIPAKYALVSLLLDELRDGFSKPFSEDGYQQRFEVFRNVPLLVLDDLGMQASTPWVNEKLETLVDYRYMNKLSLVVTTNKSLDEMSPRLASRLARHPNAKLVLITAEEFTLRRTMQGGKRELPA